MKGMGKMKRRIRKKIKNCQLCGSPEKLTIDHKIKRSLGGKDNFENLQMLCETCHQKKDKHKCKLVPELKCNL